MSVSNLLAVSSPPTYNFSEEPDLEEVVKDLNNWWIRNGKIIQVETSYYESPQRSRVGEIEIFLQNGRALNHFSKTLNAAKHYSLEQNDLYDTSKESRKLQELIHSVSCCLKTYQNRTAWGSESSTKAACSSIDEDHLSPRETKNDEDIVSEDY